MLNTKAMDQAPDGDTDYFDIVTGFLQEDISVSYTFLKYIIVDYVLRTSIDLIK